jgi:hypothetical protein
MSTGAREATTEHAVLGEASPDRILGTPVSLVASLGRRLARRWLRRSLGCERNEHGCERSVATEPGRSGQRPLSLYFPPPLGSNKVHVLISFRYLVGKLAVKKEEPLHCASPLCSGGFLPALLFFFMLPKCRNLDAQKLRASKIYQTSMGCHN